MNDLISRRAAIEMFHREANIGWNHGIETTVADAFKEAAEMVENLPAAEPRVVTMKLDVDKESLKKVMEKMELTIVPAAPRKGEWLDDCGGMACSCCGFSCDDPYYLGEANYCPNCGARMEE